MAIKDVAERTGLSAGTIRMWEQRYGFPEPQRTPAGYRIYTEDDVEALRRVVSFRGRGLSVPAALERARAAAGPTDRPSLFGAIMAAGHPVRPQLLHKSTLIAISHAIEDETLARAAGPVVVGAFQHERHYRKVEHRYRRLAQVADACLAFADFAEPGGGDGEPVRLPIAADDALGNEWAVIVDAPGFAASLVAWEQPGTGGGAERERRFEAIWTLDPEAARRACRTAARMAAAIDPATGERLDALLADRPLALEQPVPALTALANRVVGYLER
jgi:MerR family transcriptional regulator, light-induced transcriptional regulator